MRKNVLTLPFVCYAAALGCSVAAAAQMHPVPSAEQKTPLGSATVQHIEAADTPEMAAAKAAMVLPRPWQSSWMRLERTFFIHFGPNTFRGVEWGTGHEDPSIFQPTALDADQWMRTVRDGGGRLVILVCKHHDGFTLWPSRYTQHSVAASPWRSGQGDEVREVARAARKYGIELGVYLSPADLWQLAGNTSNPQGYYGNGRAEQPSVIPTDPASFVGEPSRQRKVAAGLPAFHYTVDDYNRYYLNQLYELLTEYGPIREVWFDGANPDRRVSQHYDYAAWYEMIRTLQPNAVIFGKGPDGRWVGNEQGLGRTTEWDVVPLSSEPAVFRWPDMTANDLGSRAKLTPGSYLWWYPPETNAPILHGWFWSAQKECRTAAQLVDMYYSSVGRNGNWMLNLSPDSRGLIPDDQVAQVRAMAAIVRKTFAIDLARTASARAEKSAAHHAPSAMLDGNLDTWWEAEPGSTSANVEILLPKPTRFDVVSLQEAVDHRGQRVESFALDIWQGRRWQEIEQGTTIGHKRLIRLKAPVTTTLLRVRILASRLAPSLAEVALFKQAAVVDGPLISDRDPRGVVTLSAGPGQRIVYTTGGTMPHATSPGYRTPLHFPKGGVVQAAVLLPHGRLSLVTGKHFVGLIPANWTAVAGSGSGNAQAAIDGNADTVWESPADASKPAIEVDLGALQWIAGFAYQPRHDGSQAGVVEEYTLDGSEDAIRWQTLVAAGRFDNMRNNPDSQEVRFPATRARYLRLTALKTFGDGKRVSAAELSVLAP